MQAEVFELMSQMESISKEKVIAVKHGKMNILEDFRVDFLVIFFR